MEPNEALHEQVLPDTGQIADIFDGERVTEVQTGLLPLCAKSWSGCFLCIR